MPDYKYIKSIDSNKATIYLYGDVGDKIDGEVVASEIVEANARGVNEIEIRINSGGGSVLQGYSILGAMFNSQATIKTFNDGVAFSMAGIILLAGKERYAYDFSKLMLHEPSMWGETIDTIEDTKARNLLIAFKSSFVSIIKTKTGKVIKDIEELLHNETVYSAKEAKSEGFIDEIIKLKADTQFQFNNLTTEQLLSAVAQINNNMDAKDLKLVTSHLGLNIDADARSILDKIKEMESKIVDFDKLKTELKEIKVKLAEADEKIKTMKTENEDLKTKEADANKKLAEEIVNKAIEDGKFKEDKKDELLASANKDLDGFKAIADAMVIIAPDILAQIKAGGDDGKRKDKDGNPKTFKQLTKEDSNYLQDLIDNNPAEYKKLYKAEYGTEPVM